MTGGIKAFLGAFCVVSAMMGALFMLIPNGKLSKCVKYAFSLCFLCAVLSVFSLRGGFKTELQTGAEVSENGQISAAAAELVFKTALSKAGISYSDLEVLTSKDSSGGIDIIEVVVYSECSADEIIAAIGGDSYGVSVVNE